MSNKLPTRRRMIDPCIWQDVKFGRLSDKAKVLFIACITNADDEGRLIAHPANVRAMAFRYEDISLAAISKLILEVQDVMDSFIVYSVNDCDYIQLGKWNEYQTLRQDRVVKSSIPPVNQMSAGCQPSVNQVSAQDKLSEVKLSKYKQRMVGVFEDVWKEYPNKDGKKDALKHFISSVKTEEDINNIKVALNNYINSDQVSRGFIKNGSTWFNNWKDWVVDPKHDESKALIEKMGKKYGLKQNTNTQRT